MKKTSQLFGFLLMVALFGVSCVKETATPPELSKAAIDQLDKSRTTWNQQIGSMTKMIGYKNIGIIKNADERAAIIATLSSTSAHTAYGNMLDAQTVHVETIGSITAQNPDGIGLLKATMDTLIHVGDNIIEITWEKNGSRFTQKCLTNEAGIAWDNMLFGVWMMNLQPIEETVGNTSSLVPIYSKTYKAWYDANWIWGTRRGQMGYQITIYYSGTTVSSTSSYAWAYLNIGSATGEHKVIKNSGSYGNIQFAIGLATPLASVSFNSSLFKVTVSGVGSNAVSNGTQSLYP
jgi:hypothetical protein